jgi:hypothetical protein
VTMTAETSLHGGDVKDTEDDSTGSKKSEETTPPIDSAIGNRSGSMLKRQDDPFAPREDRRQYGIGM